MADDGLSLAAEFPNATYQNWLSLAEKALKGASVEQSLLSKTYEGLDIKPLYSRSDQRSAPTPRPGRPQPGPWDIRQVVTNPDPAEANAEILGDLSGGAGSVFIALSADGSDGVSISDGKDLERLLDGVILDAAPVALSGGAAFAHYAELFLTLPALRRAQATRVTASLGADPLGTLAKTGILQQGLTRALTDMTRLATDLSETFPNARTVRLDSTVYHSAGADEATDLACLLATGAAYLRAMEQGGLKPEVATRTIELCLPVDADIFLAIAKLRAARGLWARLLDACGVSPDRAFLHAGTAPRLMSRNDPWVNLLRATTTTFAAALGGADAITALPHDWALGLPTAFSRRIARNIQTVLAEESNLGRVIDPAGGGWYVETLTDALSQKAWKRFQDIEAKGGMAQALTSGYLKKRLAETWDRRRHNLAHRVDPLTGISAFPNIAEEAPPTKRAVPSARSADETKANNGATTVSALPIHRLAEDFEALRDAARAHQEKTGAPPKVFLAGLGAPVRHISQIGFAKNYFEAGGIEAITTTGPVTVEDYIKGYEAGGASCAVICGDEDQLTEQGAALAQALKQVGADPVFVAMSRPESLKNAPIDGVIAPGDDVPARLTQVMNQIGVRQG